MINQSPPTQEMLLRQTIEKFWETFPPLWQEVRAHIRQVATEGFAITVEQFHILRYIRRGQGSISEIAEARHISRPAISQAVDALVIKELITRREDAHDRRYVQLELTAQGSELLDAIFEDTRQWMKCRLVSLTSEELQGIIQALSALKQAFEQPVES